ncbi:hypothetical protein BH10ACI4_BH10ACI4_07700 [soil metagenome]
MTTNPADFANLFDPRQVPVKCDIAVGHDVVQPHVSRRFVYPGTLVGWAQRKRPIIQLSSKVTSLPQVRNDEADNYESLYVLIHVLIGIAFLIW